MPIDPDQLREHYASLSDDQLLAMNRDDLTEVAQTLYDRELDRRDLKPDEAESVETGEYHTVRFSKAEDEDDTAAADDGMFIATAFTDHAGSSAAGDAENARRTLQAAGISCEVEVREIPAGTTYSDQRFEYQVLVPTEFTLQATSVLDKEIYNPGLAAEWKTHLADLTDKQLLALNIDAVCAGFLDRAERLRKAYDDEIRRRKV